MEVSADVLTLLSISRCDNIIGRFRYFADAIDRQGSADTWPITADALLIPKISYGWIVPPKIC